MGLVLDSSVLIAAEREKRPVSQLLASSITVMELEHGCQRANTPEAASKRRRYLDEVLAIIPVEPFTREMGVLAAKIDADMKKAGLVIATADRSDRAALRLRHRNPQRPPLPNDPRAQGPLSLAELQGVFLAKPPRTQRVSLRALRLGER